MPYALFGIKKGPGDVLQLWMRLDVAVAGHHDEPVDAMPAERHVELMSNERMHAVGSNDESRTQRRLIGELDDDKLLRHCGLCVRSTVQRFAVRVQQVSDLFGMNVA